MIHRCEVGPEVGTGHFFRQLALAEEGRVRGHDPMLLVGGLTTALVEQAEAAGVEVEEVKEAAGSQADAQAAAEVAAEAGHRTIVVDGYTFGPDYFRRLGATFDVVVAVDDLGEQAFPVDLLVNVNPHAPDLQYEGPARCLLGPRYALLRRQFVAARERLEREGASRVPGEVERVVVAFGGADIGDMCVNALRALDSSHYRGEVDVILGPAAPSYGRVRDLAAEGSAEVRVHRNVTGMADLLSGQHLAMCAAGGMSWELACLGVPMIQTTVAGNQRPIAQALRERGIAAGAGTSSEVTSEALAKLFREIDTDRSLRRRMSRHGMDLVDGRGARRVLEAIDTLKARAGKDLDGAGAG